MSAIFGKLIEPVTELVGKFIPDADKKAELAAELATLAERQAHSEVLAQLEINKAEAGHKSVFVAGWRPALGWVCVLALASNYVISPYVNAFLNVEIPPLDVSVMMPLILGMLGLVGTRGLEKVKGVARER